MTAINDLLQPAIALAREQYGEREYTYFRTLHYWRSARRRGQKGRWFSGVSRDTVTPGVYEENVEQGKDNQLAEFRGKLNNCQYYTYHREKSEDGWQDALITIIEEVQAVSDPSLGGSQAAPTAPASGSAPGAGVVGESERST